MRRLSMMLFAAAAIWMTGDHPVAQAQQSEACGLKFRRGIPEVTQAREAKKRRMRGYGVPERYLYLLDKMECVWCIETAPDTLHITVLYNDDEHAPTLSTGERDLKVEFKWSAQSERQLRDELSAGRIRAFYVWIHEKRCTCCPDLQQKAEDFSDWNDDTELNMDEAQHYDDPSDLGPLPDDLKPPPPGSQIPAPPIERFDDLPRPSRRVLQATCKACEGLAQQWTNENSSLNFLWDRKIEQMRRVSVIANARANRYNEIQRLEYEQRFDSTRSYNNQQAIKELKAVNEAQESDQDRAEQEIERLDQQIRETEMRMEELMQKFLECEKTCKQTTTTATTSNTTAPTVADAPAVTPAAPGQPSSSQPAAACPDCSALAQRVADLQKAIAGHEAEIAGHQEATGRNATNIDNLTQMRREAAASGDTTRVGQFEARIRELQNSNREHRAEIFKHREEITTLSEQIEAAQRELEACNSGCVDKGLTPNTGAGTTGTSRGASRRAVAVDPLPPLPTCKECEPLVQQLRAEHERLQRMAQRANDLQIDSDINEAEEQRAKVEALKRELEKCKCPTTTDNAPNNTANRTGADTDRVAVNDNSGDGIRVAGADTRPPGVVTTNRPGTGLYVDPPPAGARTIDDLTSVESNSGDGVVCSGPDCGDEWAACSATNSCAPIDQDCGVPGTCVFRQPTQVGSTALINMANAPGLFQTTTNIRVNDAIQNKFMDALDWHPQDWPQPGSTNASADYGFPIPPADQPQARSWLNPLGLLARRIVDNIEHWRGSFSHRPLIESPDLHLVENSLGSQSAGLAKGLHVLLTDRGGSTGKTLTMQVLNLTGQPVRLGAMPFAIEPLRQEAAKQVQQAFGRLSRSAPARFDVAAYCVDFLKLPPQANTVFRLAPASIQKKYEAMSKVLRSAYRVQQAGLLRPDSNPAAYTDSIKQWAVWAVEQRFNESRFTEAFIGHTKKNVEAAGQQWPKQAEEMIRKAAPNRWRDIGKVLAGAGLPVPQ
jgi:predicted  nucleic acid-binding Zn-ribbon protein